MIRRIALAVILSLVPASGTAQVTTADSALEVRVREIAAGIRCPVCLNLSIQDSPSELARDMRDVIRDRLKRGETEEQIKQYFEARYGDWVYMKPTARGVNLLVWLLPVLALAGGAALVILAVRRWTGQTAGAGGPADEAVSEEYLRKIEQESRRDDVD